VLSSGGCCKTAACLLTLPMLPDCRSLICIR
jgi:hypothetical protein